MTFDPKQIHFGVKNQDPQAEKLLASYLRNSFFEDYSRTLGPFAEDYLQELTFAVIEGIRKDAVEHPQFLRTYCQTIAARKRVDGIRYLARTARRLISIEETPHLRSRERDIEGDLIAAQELSIMLRCFDVLDEESREIVRRWHFAKHSIHKIERDLGLTHEQLRGKRDRAVKKLRERYREITCSKAGGFRVIEGGRNKGGLKAAA